MQYISTRDKNQRVSAAQAIAMGIAPDGGLFCPTEIPKLTQDDIRALCEKDYRGRSAAVIGRFLKEFSEEELRALQQYLDELPETETPSEEETAELYRKAAESDSLAKSMLVQLWLPKVIETAKEMHTRDFFLMDLVQEGNVGLLVALESVVKAETAEQAIDAAVRETISDFMEEHRVQKHKDNTVVNKVNRLKDAIEELSDGDDMDFSVAELSAYLDMSVEEIEDILRIAGEEP